MTSIDIREDARDTSKPVTQASDASLKNVATLAQLALDLETQVAELTARAGEAAAQLRVLLEEQLPEAMDGVGIEKFTTTSGRIIEIKKIVAGSIPVANRPKAFAWLREHGHGELIKREISVSLGRGMDKIGDQAIAALRKLKLEPEAKDSVHAGTLGKWARELLSEGQNLPTDLLGIFVGRRAHIK